MLSLFQEYLSFGSINLYELTSVVHTPIYQFVLLSLPFYFTNSLGETLSRSATLKMVARLGCLRLQT